MDVAKELYNCFHQILRNSGMIIRMEQYEQIRDSMDKLEEVIREASKQEAKKVYGDVATVLDHLNKKMEKLEVDKKPVSVTVEEVLKEMGYFNEDTTSRSD